MEKKVFKPFRLLNAALGEVSPLSHNVLYYICNNLKLNNTTRAEIERIKIVLRLKMWDEDTGTTRQLKNCMDKITSCTNELEEKGFIVKDVIYDKTKGKRKTFYAIPERFLETETTSVGQNSEAKRQKTWVTNKGPKYEKNESIQSNKETKDEKQELSEEWAKVERIGKAVTSSGAGHTKYRDEDLPF